MIKKVQKQNEKLRRLKLKPKLKQKAKTFDEYFQECIKNKSIPKDTPPYLKKALERAMKEYDNGIKHEKSAFQNFTDKYVINGKPGLIPIHFFAEKDSQLKEFLRNHRNIRIIFKIFTHFIEDNFYFHSEIHENLESTDEKVILSQMINEIMEKLANFLKNGSQWYFKQLISLDIYTVDYKPMKGDSYIPLPEFIMRKKAIINMENKDNKCFIWSVLRYLHPVQKNAPRINNLREYENDLNFKGLDFPVKLKDITKFENQNPDLPGINICIFSK